MIKRLPTLLLTLILLIPSSAANFRFHHLTSENGLPHQQAEALLQDEKGYIWIGTRNGLSRYDGYTFENYFHDESNPNSLCNNFVQADLFMLIYRNVSAIFMEHAGKGHVRNIALFYKSIDLTEATISGIVRSNLQCG